MTRPATLLEITDLAKRFGAVRALDGVTLDVADGEIFGLIGPNGSGKTTLFNCVTGFHRPTGGTVRWLGRDVTGHRPERLVEVGLARTFQHVMTFSSETVRRNIATACEAATARPMATSLPAETDEIIDFCGLTAVAHVTAADLSYGQARTLGVALSLATRPRLLLLDEPASGLNDAESSGLADLLRTLNRRGLTLLVIDHDMSFLLPLVDRVAVLDSGRKLTEGDPGEVRRDPAVIEAYLGTGFRKDTRSDGARRSAADDQSQRAGGLVATGLRAGYGGPDVLHDVSLKVGPSEAVAILGANGAGKTTLIRAVSGVLQLTGGTVRYGAAQTGGDRPDAATSITRVFARVKRAIRGSDGHEREFFAEGLVHVPEDRHVFTGMTVRDNLLVAARSGDEPSADDLLDWVLEIFPALRDKLDIAGGSLSGGQQQMLAVGRGLMSRPKLLCLDEPSLGLAPALMESLTESILAMLQSTQMSLLIVEQSAPMALELADRVYVMQNGRIVHEAHADDLSVEQLTDRYFGVPDAG